MAQDRVGDGHARMHLAAKFLDWLSRRAAPLLAVALFVGVLLPDLARAFRPLLGPSILVLLFATLLRIDWADALSHLRRPLPVLVALAWLLLGAPLAMWAAVRIVGPPDSLGHALVLAASSPVLISVPTFALMLGLDAALSLVLVLVTALLQPLLQPPLALALLGVELEIGVLALMTRLALFVGAAAALALAVRRIAGPARIERNAGPVGGLAVLMMIVFGIGVVDGLAATLLARPGHVLLFLAAAFIGNFALQAVGAAMFAALARAGLYDRRAGLTVALASGNRNLGILIAVLGPAADPDLLLYLAVAQFPMYVIPAALGPLYRRLLR